MKLRGGTETERNVPRKARCVEKSRCVFTYRTRNDSAPRGTCACWDRDRRIVPWTQRCCSSAGRCTWISRGFEPRLIKSTPLPSALYHGYPVPFLLPLCGQSGGVEQRDFFDVRASLVIFARRSKLSPRFSINLLRGRKRSHRIRSSSPMTEPPTISFLSSRGV